MIFAPCAPPARTPGSEHSLAIPQIMSLQRLYNLDRTFSDQLNELLHDKAYIDGLWELPDHELVQLADHLNDVRSTSVR